LLLCFIAEANIIELGNSPAPASSGQLRFPSALTQLDCYLAWLCPGLRRPKLFQAEDTEPLANFACCHYQIEFRMQIVFGLSRKLSSFMTRKLALASFCFSARMLSSSPVSCPVPGLAYSYSSR